jgi:hypothetical protein
VIASDHNHARLGEDVLQLGNQIGFLRSIHANSIFGRMCPADVQQKPGQSAQA